MTARVAQCLARISYSPPAHRCTSISSYQAELCWRFMVVYSRAGPCGVPQVSVSSNDGSPTAGRAGL
eukprot:8690530-Alexandrium_andersonii.AAC.1